jgi:endonuclease/exonuclease/phosphatase family metal-dependent hydrolase
MPIDIINVHLDDISHAKRISEIKSIEEEIGGAKKVILGGDFNQDYKPKSNLYKLLNRDMGLKIYIKDPTYLIEKKMCIDHLMTKGFGRDSCGCVVNNFGDDVLQQFKEYGSDHLPIIIKV